MDGYGLITQSYVCDAEFNYESTMHNVVVVDEAGYRSCKAGAGANTFRSGNAKLVTAVTLPSGKSFFICTFPGHCERGMKIAVTAR